MTEIRKAKRSGEPQATKPQNEIRKELLDLFNMTDQLEKQFEMALEIAERSKDPPFTKEEWRILCELCDVPGFEEYLFFQKRRKKILRKNHFFIFPHKMNPHEVNQYNLINKDPIKKQIKGRTDITVPFRK